GVPCRLLDIQDLLSDSGVGRQQHVIVSQGQLDAVLNSRPEERRAIIEEAAGVLKYRKRREKAQRRLDATEANFLRLQDLLREVRRQLRPLERQADAARRHGALVEELAALRLYLAGRELAGLRTRSESGARTKTDLVEATSTLSKALSELDAGITSAEGALAAHGGDDLSELLRRYEGIRERARGVLGVLTERRRGIDRDREAFVDQAVIASLEADHAALRAELDEVEAEAARLVPQADELAEAESGLAAERAEFEATWGDGTPAPVASEAAEVRGELHARRSSAERGATELQRAESRLASLAQKEARLATEAVRLTAERESSEQSAPDLADHVEAAEARRVGAEAAQGDAETALRDVGGEAHAWRARAEALALALDEARARAGAERLADVDGVVGTLLDLVDIDEGWEAAFEAAAGEAIAAVVVDSVEAGRRALAHLQAGDAAGAVLALGAPALPVSLPFEATAVGQPLRERVRSARSEVEALLDVLLAPAIAIDGPWEQALDLALAHPELVVVTLDGDRFAGGGHWRTGAAGAGATGAALEEAVAKASEAEASANEASEHARLARAEVGHARADEQQSTRALEANERRMANASTSLQRIDGERSDVATETETLSAHLAELRERVDREHERVAELERLLPDLEAEEAAGQERLAGLRSARNRLDHRAAAVSALRTDLEVRAAGLEERRTFLSRRVFEVDERLKRNIAQRDQAEQGRVALDQRARATDRLSATVKARLELIEERLGDVRARRQQQSDAARAAAEHLDGLRRRRSESERKLTELRERLQRAEIEEAEVRLRLETALETLRRDFDCEPETATKAECPELPPGTSAPTRTRELERELRLMGPINPLALEEHTALQERHEFLQGQLDDVKNGRRELAKVIKAVDAEIVEVFASAYADVAENFNTLFGMLFPGGTGRLKLTDPDHLLDTGIEVEAKPSGKNVKQLSLLSGGERSLTALAFLFAVFRSRPSPFYLMDEVEAALDDVNLHRFLELVDEFRREAQLVIGSHQKRTMEAADCLYGVTMQSGGSSKVVSEKVAAGN
ncbi:MAG: chromosome segregation protein SMC, partial [Acidimicrobiales bacterium]